MFYYFGLWDTSEIATKHVVYRVNHLILFFGHVSLNYHNNRTWLPYLYFFQQKLFNKENFTFLQIRRRYILLKFYDGFLFLYSMNFFCILLFFFFFIKKKKSVVYIIYYLLQAVREFIFCLLLNLWYRLKIKRVYKVFCFCPK